MIERGCEPSYLKEGTRQACWFLLFACLIYRVRHCNESWPCGSLSMDKQSRNASPFSSGMLVSAVIKFYFHVVGDHGINNTAAFMFRNARFNGIQRQNSIHCELMLLGSLGYSSSTTYDIVIFSPPWNRSRNHSFNCLMQLQTEVVFDTIEVTLLTDPSWKLPLLC